MPSIKVVVSRSASLTFVVAVCGMRWQGAPVPVRALAPVMGVRALRRIAPGPVPDVAAPGDGGTDPGGGPDGTPVANPSPQTPSNPGPGANEDSGSPQIPEDLDPNADPLIGNLAEEGLIPRPEDTDQQQQTEGPTFIQSPVGTAIPIATDPTPSASTDDVRYQTDTFSAGASPGAVTRSQTACTGTSCTVTYADTATETFVTGTTLIDLIKVTYYYYTYRNVEFELEMVIQSDPTDPRFAREFLGNLDYSRFGLSGGLIIGGTNYNARYAYGFSEGDATGSNPTDTDLESGSWIGWMTGGDISSGDTRFNMVLGRAEITVKDLSTDAKADVSFTGIRDVTAKADVSDISWTDLDLTNGAFSSGSDGDSIAGTFYGPAHEEVGGVFEKSSIAGSFGAAWNTYTPGSLSWPVTAATARTNTGMAVSALANDAALTTLDTTITGATDGFLHSDILLFSGSSYTSAGREETTCSGGATSCTLGSSSYSFDDFEDGRPQASDYDFEIERVGKKSDVEVAQVRSYNTQSSATVALLGYGGWLQHSAFGGIARRYHEGSLGSRKLWSAASYSFGDATGSNPAADGTWSGQAIGIDVSGGLTHGNVIQGDASVTFTLADTDVDVSFTNLKNIDTNTSLTDMSWTDLTVTDGAFSTGSNGDSIAGQFYGSSHDEVGGIFEKDSVLGAFGGT